MVLNYLINIKLTSVNLKKCGKKLDEQEEIKVPIASRQECN